MNALTRLLKKSKPLWVAYTSIGGFFMKCLSIISPTLASKKMFKNSFGYKLDLKNPKTLNEKLMYLKLKEYWKNDLVTICADKYLVREFVRKNECSEILNDIYGVWDSAKDIDWESLPNKFVLKCNHGSGFNIVCTDKQALDKKKTISLLNKWMHKKYGVEFVEHGVYSKIKRKIIAEKYIETKNGLPPADYKFFCSYGEVSFLFVATDRYDDKTKFDYYWPDWNYIPVKNYFENNGPVEKPKELEKMIRLAEKLSKQFPLVRVDFYAENSKIIFGELTFTHFGCLNRFEPNEYDLIFGNCFPLFDKGIRN